jgi:hypothetical protein
MHRIIIWVLVIIGNTHYITLRGEGIDEKISGLGYL